MGNGDWGAGFATGLAAGDRSERSTQYVEIPVSDLKAEREIVMYHAALEGQKAVRNALFEVIREIAPQHPLSAGNAGDPLGPSANKIYDEVHDRIVATGLDDDPELRRMCPGLVEARDARRAAEAQAKAKAEAERLKAEAKAANPGIFKRLFG